MGSVPSPFFHRLGIAVWAWRRNYSACQKFFPYYSPLPLWERVRVRGEYEKLASSIKNHRLLRGDGRGGGVAVRASRSGLLGYGRSAGLGVALIVTAATFGAPAPSVCLGVIAPVSLGILVALVNGACAVSRAVSHALALALTLPAAPALAPLAFATHLRHTGRRPEQNHGQSQD
jgi:hypothetical protein